MPVRRRRRGAFGFAGLLHALAALKSSSTSSPSTSSSTPSPYPTKNPSEDQNGDCDYQTEVKSSNGHLKNGDPNYFQTSEPSKENGDTFGKGSALKNGADLNNGTSLPSKSNGDNTTYSRLKKFKRKRRRRKKAEKYKAEKYREDPREILVLQNPSSPDFWDEDDDVDTFKKQQNGNGAVLGPPVPIPRKNGVQFAYRCPLHRMPTVWHFAKYIVITCYFLFYFFNIYFIFY